MHNLYLGGTGIVIGKRGSCIAMVLNSEGRNTGNTLSSGFIQNRKGQLENIVSVREEISCVLTL